MNVFDTFFIYSSLKPTKVFILVRQMQMITNVPHVIIIIMEQTQTIPLTIYKHSILHSTEFHSRNIR